jgi:tetratricopeptide (TPR) repeat protein
VPTAHIVVGRDCPPLALAVRRLVLGGLCLGLVGCGRLARNDNAQGVALYQQGNYLGAVNHFQQALAKQPGNPDCFYNLGATYHQQAKLFGRPADLQTAEQYYHLCLARKPDHETCQRALAVLLVEENRPAEAAAQLQAWSRSPPMNPTPHIELARLAQEHGDLGGAQNQLNDALAVDPANTRALVALGQLQELSGDPALAAATYSRALAIDPVQPTVAAKVVALNNASTAAARTAAQPVATPVAVMPPAAAVPPPGTPGTVAR